MSLVTTITSVYAQAGNIEYASFTYLDFNQAHRLTDRTSKELMNLQPLYLMRNLINNYLCIFLYMIYCFKVYWTVTYYKCVL